MNITYQGDGLNYSKLDTVSFLWGKAGKGKRNAQIAQDCRTATDTPRHTMNVMRLAGYDFKSPAVLAFCSLFNIPVPTPTTEAILKRRT